MNPDPGRRERGASTRAPRQNGLWLAVRDVLIAAVAVAVVIGSIFAYSGTWPPMVVIESGSMEHAPDRSMLGVIDTGDLTLVKNVARVGDIMTYMEGLVTGYRTYGSFGDVLIYAKDGHRELTPIIHRAITWIEVNATTNATYDFPELQVANKWNIPPSETRFNLGPVWTWDSARPNGAEVNLTIDLQRITDSMRDTAGQLNLHAGFITKGDHNTGIDQGALQVIPGHPVTVEPVKFEWVVGKAEGELPWFGAIKLWVGGNGRSLKPNTQWNLLIAIAIIAVGPFLLETAWGRYGDRVAERIPKAWRDRWHAGWERLPGGKRRAQRRNEREEGRAEERRRRGGRRHGGRAR